MTVRSTNGEIVEGETHVDTIETVEHFQHAGFFHTPEESAQGVVLYIGVGESHGILINPGKKDAVTGEPGETILYSVADGVIQAQIIMDRSGNINLNGDDKSFVTYAELNSGLQQLATDFNGHIHPSNGAVPTTPITINISAAETQTIKTGG